MQCNKPIPHAEWNCVCVCVVTLLLSQSKLQPNDHHDTTNFSAPSPCEISLLQSLREHAQSPKCSNSSSATYRLSRYLLFHPFNCLHSWKCKRCCGVIERIQGVDKKCLEQCLKQSKRSLSLT